MDQPLNLQDAIRNLQTYLRAISFTDSRITRVPIDGLFDTDTQKAVGEFQSTRGLPETGVVDKDTWDAIYSEYLTLHTLNDSTPSINFFPSQPPDYEAQKGDRLAFVALVQAMLRELSVIYDGLPQLEINGIFDGDTEDAVKRFQELSLIPVTGRVDRLTWNRLSRDLASYSSSQ